MTAHPPQPMRSRLTVPEWKLILVLAAINFTHIIDFVIIMPLGDRLMTELGIQPWQFANIVSAYGLAAFAASLAAGAVMDRFDRKHVLLAMYAGFAVSTLFCGLASSYEILLVSRALAGTFGGLAASAIMAVIGDTIPTEKRGSATGAVMSAFAVASIAGLPAGLALANWLGRGAPFIALAGVSVVVWGTAWVRLPRMRGHVSTVARSPLADFVAVFREPNHRRAFAFTFAVVLGTFTVIPFIGPYMTTNAGRSEADLPIIYAVAGGCTLVSMNLMGRLSDRVSRRWLFRIVAGATLIVTLLITNLPRVSLPIAVLAATLFMVCASGRMVPAQALLIGCAVPRLRGGFLSVNTAMQHLATGVAPMIGGAMMGRDESGQLTGYPVVGLVAAAFAVLSIVLIGRLRPGDATGVPVVPKEAGEETSREQEPKPTAL